MGVYRIGVKLTLSAWCGKFTRYCGGKLNTTG